MNEKSDCINKDGIGPYIKKCLEDVHDGDMNWLGEEVYRRLNHGEEPTGQALATCHYQVKQWVGDVKGSHLPSIDVLFALSGIFGKSVDEILAGQDFEERQKPHLTLYNVAQSNNVALYQQLCAKEIDCAKDEYDHSLLDYVLQFRSEKVLLAMLANPENRIQLYDTYAVDPASAKAVSLGRFLPTAAKSKELFLKLYPPEIPWSIHSANPLEPYPFVIDTEAKAVATLLKQDWAREMILKDYEQRCFEWIDKVNHCHVTGPFSDRPYLCGAFNAALEVSLDEGDLSFAQFGITHNKAFLDFLAQKKIETSELEIELFGRVTYHDRPVAALAYLPPACREPLLKRKDVGGVLKELADTFKGLER
jgi:hypothetical protein